MTRILGIDPGSRVTGYGLIDSDGVRSRHLANGCLRVQEDDFPARLGRIFAGVAALIEDYGPELLAIEQVFVSKNVASAMKLGQARGAAICAAVTRDLPVHEYSPRSIKQAVVEREPPHRRSTPALGQPQQPACRWRPSTCRATGSRPASRTGKCPCLPFREASPDCSRR